MPVRNVLVRNARGDIEHDDTALAVDVITVSQTTKFLLAGSVPDIELNLAVVLYKSLMMWVATKLRGRTVVKARG